MKKKILLISLLILIIGISAYYTNWFTFQRNGIPFKLEEQADECEAHFAVFLSDKLGGVALVEIEFGKRVVIERDQKNHFTFIITIDGEDHLGTVDWYHNEDRIDIFYKGEKETISKLPSDNTDDEKIEENNYFYVGDKVKSIEETLWVSTTPELFEETQILYSTRNISKLTELRNDGLVERFPDDYAVVIKVLDKTEALGLLQVEFSNKTWFVDGSYLDLYTESETDTQVEENEQQNEEEGKNEEAKTEVIHDKISVSQLKKISRFEETLIKSKKEYHVYIYSLNEKTRFSDGTQANETKGDKIYFGDYRIAFHQTGESEAIIHETKLDSFIFNSSLEQVFVLQGGEIILNIVFLNEEKGLSGEIFFIKNNELKHVKNSEEFGTEFYPETKLKYHDADKYYQYAFVGHGLGGYSFVNIKLDQDQETIQVEETIFGGMNDNRDELGLKFYKKWMEEKNFILTKDMY